MKQRRSTALPLTRAALVGAMYVALTYLSTVFGLSSGVIQFRFSEMLCILPIFFPETVFGLFVGCIISNIISGCVFWDILFGSIATLIGALGTLFLRKLPDRMIFLTTLPTVFANAVIVPFVLIYAYAAEGAYPFFFLTVMIGEVTCATVGGTLLYNSLKKVFKK